MKIVIAGVGEVGSHLARMLGEEMHDITVIDDDPKNIENISGFSDIVTITGDATTFEALAKAEVSKANLFIAVGPVESKNIIAATLAKQLGAKKSIARIDNDEYLRPNNTEIFINMGIDYLFYPEMVAAEEVITLLGNTGTSEYVNFSGGKLSLVVFKLSSSSPLVDHTLAEMTDTDGGMSYRTVAISRKGKTIIPTGSEYFKEDDTIYIITDKKSMDELLELSGRDNVKVRNMMILGGSKIGQRVALALQNQVNVKLVDYNEEKAHKLAEMLDNTLVIAEDGRNTEVMIEEDLGGMDAFVAVTGRSETNILAAMLAKKMGVKKVIVEIENLNYISLAENMGVDTVINKKLTTASSIFRFTMNTDVQAIKCLNGCDAEVLEFIAKPDSPITKGPLRDTHFPEGATIGGVVRGDKVFIAKGDTEIKAYDRVVVFSLPDAISKIGRFFI
ncbi:MAG: Trk system potassium transporter TrkA [Rikenellaceae bacterium]|nr:Trk system potassium transporter TrkA [Rikenellaceae bacterium]